MRGLFLRGLGLMALDAAAWVVALSLVTLARFEFSPSTVDWSGAAAVAGGAIVVQVALGFATGLYRGRMRVASFEEVGPIGAIATVIGIILTLVLLPMRTSRPVPLSVVIGGPGVFVVLSLGARYIWRLVRHEAGISQTGALHRAVVFGAGEGGHEVARTLLRDPEATVKPVVFLDDDPGKRRLRVFGCRVVGGREAIAEVASEHSADTMIIACPSAERSEVAAVAMEARRAGLNVLILPRMAKYLETEIGTRHIRALEFQDFLGRREVQLNLDEIAHFLQGKRVLVTGAGGSIGSELCAVVSRFRPSQLSMLDRDENGLQRLQLRLEGKALLDSESLIVADIRDVDAVNRVMRQVRPEVVFHAAALKHVTFLERFPSEAVKTNVFGTLNLLEAAREAGVGRFINISTDKAADPISVLGFSKRICEELTSSHSSEGGMVGISVRFGNVLGSQGSVVPSMERQILNGGPVTVTHPDVSRYFMTIGEAVQLVVQAGAVGRHREVLVLDMGEPVRIVDLARELTAELAPGVEIEIEYTGLRPGEKLVEVLSATGERLLRRPHEMIDAFAVPAMSRDRVDGLSRDLDDGALRRLLASVAGPEAAAEN
jgi:FlaA1/EpsC-like NDP-sugar epimerase